MWADVLPSLDVPNEGLAVDAYSEGGVDASIEDILKFVLMLFKVLDVVMKALTSLAFAS